MEKVETLRVEILEMAKRVSQYRNHLEKISWQDLWDLIVINPVEFAGFNSVIQGVKPAWIPEGINMVRKLLPLIPFEMKGIVLTKNGWIVDLKLIRRILLDHNEYFDDFGFDLIENDDYVVAYLESRKTDFYVSSEENIKTGLLLGFPNKSVIDYSSRTLGDRINLEGFDYCGYQFSSSQSDVEPFKQHLEEACKGSGMERLIGEIKMRIETDFNKYLETYDGGIEMFEVKGRKLMEIVTVKQNDKTINRQLILLNEGRLNESDQLLLLNTFAQRYQVPSFSYDEEFMGTDFLDYLEILRDTPDGYLPYLIVIEQALGAKFQPAIVRQDDLENYISENVISPGR